MAGASEPVQDTPQSFTYATLVVPIVPLGMSQEPTTCELVRRC